MTKCRDAHCPRWTPPATAAIRHYFTCLPHSFAAEHPCLLLLRDIFYKKTEKLSTDILCKLAASTRSSGEYPVSLIICVFIFECYLFRFSCVRVSDSVHFTFYDKAFFYEMINIIFVRHGHRYIKILDIRLL